MFRSGVENKRHIFCDILASKPKFDLIKPLNYLEVTRYWLAAMSSTPHIDLTLTELVAPDKWWKQTVNKEKHLPLLTNGFFTGGVDGENEDC